MPHGASAVTHSVDIIEKHISSVFILVLLQAGSWFSIYEDMWSFKFEIAEFLIFRKPNLNLFGRLLHEKAYRWESFRNYRAQKTLDRGVENCQWTTFLILPKIGR